MCSGEEETGIRSYRRKHTRADEVDYHCWRKRRPTEGVLDAHLLPYTRGLAVKASQVWRSDYDSEEEIV